LYNVTVVASVAVEASLEDEEAEKDARDAAYEMIRDDLYHIVQDADVEATDEYEEEDE
jgi:hypothetical protein